MCLWKVHLRSIAINTDFPHPLAGPSFFNKEGPAVQSRLRAFRKNLLSRSLETTSLFRSVQKITKGISESRPGDETRSQEFSGLC